MTDNNCCSFQTDPPEPQDSQSRLDECETASVVLRCCVMVLFCSCVEINKQTFFKKNAIY